MTERRGNCIHIFCIQCFKNENKDNKAHIFRCPFCKIQLYNHIKYLNEAILIGEGSYHNLYASSFVSVGRDDEFAETFRKAIRKFEEALLLNPLNFITISFLYGTHHSLIEYLKSILRTLNPITDEAYAILLESTDLNKKYYDYCFEMLEIAFDSSGNCLIDNPYVYSATLADGFAYKNNYHTALKYAKMAYEQCLRSTDHSTLPIHKKAFIEAKEKFAKQAPLRFAVGDEVEFDSGGGKWKRGKVVELYYHGRYDVMQYTAPYRIQHVDKGTGLLSAEYSGVKADLDRYVRKVGVKSIEDTRYKARLEDKVEELAQVYCSREFIRGVYGTLVRDQEFCGMLRTRWGIVLSEDMLYLYRMLVMFRHPLLRIESGYHIPTEEETIAGIKAYFTEAIEPTEHNGDMLRTKMSEIDMMRHLDLNVPERLALCAVGCVGISTESYLAEALCTYVDLYRSRLRNPPIIDLIALIGGGFCFPPPPTCDDPVLSEALSKVGSLKDFFVTSPGFTGARIIGMLQLWEWIIKFLDKEKMGEACECPFVYFFVKYALDHGLGVPRMVLIVYDRMNMQMSSDFIRCANPSCEHNKLDQSNGQTKFYKCSRCYAVIYCSRACQVAHYPEHKAYCIQAAQEVVEET